MSDRRGLPLAGVWLASPVLVTQGLRVRRRTLRLPDADGRVGGSRGADDLRLVVVGDSVAAGVGVPHHGLTVAGRLAALLAESRDRPVSWDVLARTGATAGDVLAMVREAPVVAGADVVVVSVGVNDTKNLHPDRRWRAELSALLDEAVAAAPDAAVVLVGVPPMEAFPALPRALAAVLGARARRLDRIGREVAAARRVRRLDLELTSADGLFAEDGFHPSALMHARLAAQIARLLDEPPVTAARRP